MQNNINIIFPVYPDTKQVDYEYKDEYEYAKQNHFNICLLDIEMHKIYGDKSGIWLYRGWMLSEKDDGIFIIVEVGDGQVSGLKECSIFDIYNLFV